MSKNVIIALVLGLVIGGVAIWLLLSFGVLGTTMIGGGKAVGNKSSNKIYVTDQGNKTFDELTKSAGTQKQWGYGEPLVVPTNWGMCGWIVAGGTVYCGTMPGMCYMGCQDWQADDGGWRCTCGD